MRDDTIIQYIDQTGHTIFIGFLGEYIRDFGTDDMATIKRHIRRETGAEGPIRRVDTRPGTAAYLRLTTVVD